MRSFCFRFRLAGLAALAVLAVPVTSSCAEEPSLKRFLQTFDGGKRTRYVAAFRDLNGDGTPEAIVYLVSNEWCGSGGCNTLILMRDGDSWRIITNITIVQLPIRVLTKRSNGWLSIAVWVQGGGTQPGYEAEMAFDGKTYPRNPTVPSARRLKGKPAGEVVISSVKEAIPVYAADDNQTSIAATGMTGEFRAGKTISRSERNLPWTGSTIAASPGGGPVSLWLLSPAEIRYEVVVDRVRPQP